MPRSALVLAEETIVVPALAEELSAVHSALGRLWESIEARGIHNLDDRWRAEFNTAVGEIGANIAEHAHPSSRPAGTMCLRLRLLTARVEARFADNGVAFLAASQAQPQDGAPDELAENGYGLLIARAAIDSLRYRRTPGGTNVWCLVKRFAPPPLA